MWVSSFRASWEGWLAAGLVWLFGSGLFLILASVTTGEVAWVVAGAGAVSAAAFAAVAAGWVPMLPLVAASLALPPAYASAAIRLGPALLVTLLVVAAWVLRKGIETRPILVGRMPLWSLAAFLGWLVISAGFAADRGSAARETANLILFVVFLVAATDILVSRTEGIGAVARLLGVVAGVAGGFAVLETLGILPGRFPLGGTAFYRATGGFGWPNELAMYLAISLPFAVWLVRSANGLWAKALAGASLLFAIAGLVATFSRGSWIATLLAPCVLFLVGRGSVALRVWTAVALAGVGLDLASGGAISGRIAQTLTDPLVGQRFLLTQAGVLMFLAHPVVGIGPGGFEAGLDRFGLLVPGLFDFVGSAHNTYVHVAAEVGLPGLLALVAFLAATWWTALRRARRDRGTADAQLTSTVVWSFTTACLIAFAEWTLAHGVGQLILLVAAMAFALDARASS